MASISSAVRLLTGGLFLTWSGRRLSNAPTVGCAHARSLGFSKYQMVAWAKFYQGK